MIYPNTMRDALVDIINYGGECGSALTIVDCSPATTPDELIVHVCEGEGKPIKVFSLTITELD